jgi:xylan 1,4-beta-xylosidase
MMSLLTQFCAVRRWQRQQGSHFLLTEYNDGHSASHDKQHYSSRSYAAAFVLRNIPLLAKLDAFSCWTFTDIFEEGGMTDEPFHASGTSEWGMISRRSIPKPVYRVFQLLKDAGSHTIPLEKIEQMQTGKGEAPLARSADGPVSVIVTTNGTDAAAPDERLLHVYLSHFLPTAVSHEVPAAADVTLTLAGVAAATGTLQRIDQEHANPFDLWMSWRGDTALHPWHGPVHINASQVEQLIEASQLTAEDLTASVTNGDAVVKISLPAHGVARLDLRVRML